MSISLGSSGKTVGKQSRHKDQADDVRQHAAHALEHRVAVGKHLG